MKSVKSVGINMKVREHHCQKNKPLSIRKGKVPFFLVIEALRRVSCSRGGVSAKHIWRRTSFRGRSLKCIDS